TVSGNSAHNRRGALVRTGHEVSGSPVLRVVLRVSAARYLAFTSNARWDRGIDMNVVCALVRMTVVPAVAVVIVIGG
ncbi:hypothetical protein, partial [Mycolicibacterium sp.]|uniref:hypothetical protein n=1 Tax=Mycolicibacterium sp. TaxID=2320850 RepID=UPI0037C6D591